MKSQISNPLVARLREQDRTLQEIERAASLSKERDARCEEFVASERAKLAAALKTEWENGEAAGIQIERARARAQHIRALKLIFVPLLAAMAGLILGALIAKWIL